MQETGFYHTGNATPEPCLSPKNNNLMKKQTNAKKPFFAHFLEDQNLSGSETEAVQGGQTLKYPSDLEEHTSKVTDLDGGPIHVTLKVPSDSDEAHTNKYPSDGDDDIINLPA